MVETWPRGTEMTITPAAKQNKKYTRKTSILSKLRLVASEILQK